jgi:hypothetical protein
MTEPTLQTLDVNGLPMRVAMQGSGPLVLLCDGFPANDERAGTIFLWPRRVVDGAIARDWFGGQANRQPREALRGPSNSPVGADLGCFGGAGEVHREC